MNDEQAIQLRERFPDELVGKLPRVTCKACSENKQSRHCASHKMIRCGECGNWITEAHMHLDYIGHAATTDRLLKVDREWTWYPVAYDEQGLPRIDANGGLWITLEIAGVKRLGYGAADGKKGPNAVKEAIGDAIRNVAMRFGVALDLWAKEDLSAGGSGEETTAAQSNSPRSAPNVSGKAQQPPAGDGSATPSGDILDEAELEKMKRPITKPQQRRLWTIARNDAGLSDESVKNIVVAITGQESTGAIPRYQYDQVISEILGAAVA